MFFPKKQLLKKQSLNPKQKKKCADFSEMENANMEGNADLTTPTSSKNTDSLDPRKIQRKDVMKNVRPFIQMDAEIPSKLEPA